MSRVMENGCDLIGEARLLFENDEVGKGLEFLRKALSEYPYVGGYEQIETLCDDYRLMLDYMKKGYVDSQRGEQYKKIAQKAWLITWDMEHEWRVRNNSLYVEALRDCAHLNMSHSFIRSVLESYVTDMAMLSLEPANVAKVRSEQIRQGHYDFISRLFSAIWTSGRWTEADASFYSSLMASPTIDTFDATFLTGAICIACMEAFDLYKFKALKDIYVNANDDRVKQRALVGWAFSLPAENTLGNGLLQSVADDMLKDDAVVKDLFELQEQVFFCMSAEEDNKTIQRDIMPTITKNQNFKITQQGIEELEEDRLQEILHPDSSDKAMEELEMSFKRMSDMQRAGVDIYFGGFSQMKRFPFFRKMANWLIPFSVEHPDLKIARDKLDNQQFFNILLEHGPFCDSDKYSFALALSQIVEKMPQNMREMLNSEESLGATMPEKEVCSPAYIRRMFLQDLYRFYRVFPKRNDLNIPFDEKRLEDEEGNRGGTYFFYLSRLIGSDDSTKYSLSLGYFLLKRKRWEELSLLLDKLKLQAGKEKDFLILSSYVSMHQGNYIDAKEFFEGILDIDQNNYVAKKGLARVSILLNDYGKADFLYSQLSIQNPENRSFVLNRCVALLKLKRIDDAVGILYKLYFEDSSDVNVIRLLAWGLLWQGKLDSASKFYDSILEGKPAKDDYLNAAYCMWANRNIERAVELFRRFTSFEGVSLIDELRNDTELLACNGITQTEQNLMLDLVNGIIC